jgi:hypothetical protein
MKARPKLLKIVAGMLKNVPGPQRKRTRFSSGEKRVRLLGNLVRSHYPRFGSDAFIEENSVATLSSKRIQ